MKKRLLSFGLPALVLGGVVVALWARPVVQEKAPEEAPPKSAASKITQVTVYPNSALVTREVEVPAGQGNQELVVTPLPPHTVGTSLYSEGSEGIRVLTTRFRSRPVREDTREEVRKLEDEIRQVQNNGQKLQADLKATEANLALLAKLEQFTAASTTAATEKGKLDAEATISLMKYVMDNRETKTRESVRLQQEIQTNSEKLEFASRKLKDLTAGSSKTELDAVILIDKVNAAPGKVRLNYLVDQAAWRPQYKFRSGKTPKDPVQAEYLAAVVQQTGEDWPAVRVTLSTAMPMLNATPPELSMLAVTVVPRATVASTPPMALPKAPPVATGLGGLGISGFSPYQALNPPGGPKAEGKPGEPVPAAAQPLPAITNPASFGVKEINDAAEGLRQQAQIDLSLRNSMRGTELTNYAAALEQARDLLLAEELAKGHAVAAQRHNEGPSVTYRLEGKLSIPSRNDEQVIEVARIDMAPEYFYKAVPVLTAHVYRQATLVNKSKYVLLPGEATMYDGSDFVGRMDLPMVAVGESFTVGFGAEPQLQVQRTMMSKTRTMQGGNQIHTFEYRILLSSYKEDKVKVQVWDRLPIAEGETLAVTLVKATPEVCKEALYQREERPSNLLRWDVELSPEMSGEKALAINYEFKVELDKQMTIGTLQPKEATKK